MSSVRSWLPVPLPAVVLAGCLLVGCGGGNEDALRITVVGQNILHGMLDEDPEAQPWDRLPERLPLLAEELAELRPEIVFLQEVNVTAGEDYVDVAGILAEAMGDEYQLIFGDITGSDIGEGALGQMTLTRLPVLSSENRHIVGVRAVHRVTVETTEGVIDLFNAHLDGTDEEDPQVALDEIAKVIDFIEETRTPGAAVILGGDFNAEPEDPSIRALRDFGFVDTIARAGDATCDETGDPGCTGSTKPLGDNAENLADHRIDYIFYLSGGDVLLEAEEAGLFMNRPVDLGGGRLLWVSDHIGVQTEITVEADD